MIKTKEITLSLFERYKNRGWKVVFEPVKKEETVASSLFERYKNRGWTVVFKPVEKVEAKTLNLKK